MRRTILVVTVSSVFAFSVIVMLLLILKLTNLEREERQERQEVTSHIIFLASYKCIHILCLPQYISAFIVDRAIQYV